MLLFLIYVVLAGIITIIIVLHLGDRKISLVINYKQILHFGYCFMLSAVCVWCSRL